MVKSTDMEGRTLCSPKRGSRLVCAFLMAALVAPTTGCRRETGSGAAASSDAPIPAVSRLPAELGQQVLAKVGDRTITLSDYALVLDRMDRIERLRYQTPERRRALLDEIINAELLAAEAERRGLDKEEATVAYVDQLFRDEIRRRLRANMQSPESLPHEDVQAYYADHRDEFRTPEMRRAAAIAVPDRATAVKLLQEFGTKPSVMKWNTTALRYSVEQREPGLPVEVIGDLGLLTAAPPSETKAQTDQTPERAVPAAARVPAPVRAAVFGLQTPGEVHAEPVKADGAVYLVRLLAINPARVLSLEEADAEIRVRLVNQRLETEFAALERRLAEGGGINSELTAEGK